MQISVRKKLKRNMNRVQRSGMVLLNLYLIGSMIGCAQRPSELPVSNARHIETRILPGTDKAVMKAFISVLQDDHFTVVSADRELGLITAKRQSEHALASLSELATPDSSQELKPVQKFFIIAGLAIAVGALFAIFSGSDDDQDTHHSYHHNDHYTVIGHDDYDGRTVWEYQVTANFESLRDSTTQVRLSVQGTERQGEAIESAGPVQDAEFYNDLFQKVETTLMR